MIEEFDKPYKIYTADGATKSWEYPYPYTDKDTIALYVKHNGVLAKIDAQNYTVTQVEESSVVKTYVNYPLGQDDDPVPAGDSILLWRDTAITQLEDSTDTNFKSNDIERMVDKLTMIAQELSDDYDRTVHFQPTDSYNSDANYYIETINDAKDTAVEKAGEASTSATNAAASETKAQKWAEGTDGEVAALGGTHSSKGWAAISQEAAESEAVQTVVANIEDIQAVADIQSDVTQVASIKNAVSTVSSHDTEILNVNDNLASVINVSNIKDDVTAVAGIKNDVVAVSGIKNAVTSVNANSTNINTVAGDKSNIDAVARNKSNIDTVADSVLNVETVATNIEDVNAVADDISAVENVASNLTTINDVNDNETNINKVATDIANVNTVAGDSAAINAIADDLTNIDAVADDLTNIDTAVANLPDLQDKQNKALTTAITVGGVSQTTVEGALGAIAALPQVQFTVINGGDSTNA